MRARGCLIAAGLVLCAAFGGVPAQAADEGVEVARDGEVVLGAKQEQGEVCIDLRAGGSGSASCGAWPEGTALAVPEESAEQPAYVGVVTPAEATRVEVRRAGGVVGAGATVAGEAYKGTGAGTVRFALVRLAPRTPADGLRIRALDGAGTLVAVLATGEPEELLLARRRVLSGSSRGVRWSLHEELISRLTPTVIDLGQETVSRCVRVSTRSRRSGSDGNTAACSSGSRQDELGDPGALDELEDSCDPGFRLLHGVVPADVRRVSALLGDGRRRVARMRALADGRLAYALVIAPGDALRSVTLRDGGGASQVLRKRMAPLVVGCADRRGGTFGIFTAFGFFDLDPVTPAGPVTTIAGSPPLRVADDRAGTLCLAVGDEPFTAAGCGLVSPRLDEPLFAFDDPEAPKAFALAVPARVAAIRIGTLTVATTAGAGYGGPYAGRARFAAAPLTSDADIVRLELLDAAGAVLYATPGADAALAAARPRTLPPRRLAGRRGSPSLWQTAIRFGSQTLRCLTLTAGRPPRDDIGGCLSPRSSATVRLDASCESRRLTVAVAVRAGTRVFVRTGRSTRRLRLRNGAGLLTLPSHSTLRSLSFVRRTGTRRLRVNAPPGADQCGWSAEPEVPSRR